LVSKLFLGPKKGIFFFFLHIFQGKKGGTDFRLIFETFVNNLKKPVRYLSSSQKKIISKKKSSKMKFGSEVIVDLKSIF
jgi:hypothetical protein